MRVMNSLIQRGPTRFDPRAIFQKGHFLQNDL